MSTVELQGAASGVANTIGRYFAAINTIPSLILTLVVFFLVSSGSWFGPPDVHRSWSVLGHLGLGGAALLLLAAMALSLVLHPLQFSMVQLFEGYWGTHRLAQALKAERISHHRRVLWDLIEQSDVGDAQRMIARYPSKSKEVMPTRLGNVLRRYELMAGNFYKLSAFTVIPLIGPIAPAGQLEYLNDQRMQLDLAVRTSFTAFLASGISFVFLWRHGIWLLMTLIFYSAGYLAYRGAVVAAESYGLALVNIIDLNRFELYRRLHLELPPDSRAEGEQNKKLMDFLERGQGTLTYVPSQSDADGGGSGG